MKTCWEPGERPDGVMIGRPRRIAAEGNQLIISGGSLAGKSKIEECLLETGYFLTLGRMRTRERRKSDGAYRESTSFRQWAQMSDRIRRFESSYGFFGTCREEWHYWGSLLGIKIPTPEELVPYVEESLLIIWMSKLEEAVRQAKQEGKRVVLTLPTQDALVWKKAFPESELCLITADPWVKLDRLFVREDDPSPLSIARFLDSVSESPNIGQHFDRVFSNNTLEDMFGIISELTSVRGGGLPPLTE